jgi:hypothetical protein
MKKPLQALAKSDLVALIGDLYKLSPANRDFLHSRLIGGGAGIDSYKKIIFKCMWPDRDGERFRYREAKKAIADYRNATGDESGEIELMLHYVETGNAFTCDFGDIDETFYDSVLSVCRKAANKIKKLSPGKRENFRDRMRHLVDSSDGIGWGYHDELEEIFCETFEE